MQPVHLREENRNICARIFRRSNTTDTKLQHEAHLPKTPTFRSPSQKYTTPGTHVQRYYSNTYIF